MRWCAVANLNIFKHHLVTADWHTLSSSSVMDEPPSTVYWLVLLSPYTSSCFDQRKPLIKGARKQFCRPLHHDAATASLCPSYQKILCRTREWASEWREMRRKWKREEERSAGWSGGGLRQLGLTLVGRVVQRGPCLSHPCHLTAAGLFYIMHGQHVRQTLIQTASDSTNTVHTSWADLPYSPSRLHLPLSLFKPFSPLLLCELHCSSN